MAKRVTPSHRQRIGWWGEREAEKYLLAHGLELVARNVRTPHGEIDLIMRGPDGLVFIEVKYHPGYRDWETDRKSTRLNSSHSAKSRMPSSA